MPRFLLPHRSVIWWVEGDSNPHPVTGLAPKASASANFAIYPLIRSAGPSAKSVQLSQISKYNSWGYNVQRKPKTVGKGRFLGAWLGIPRVHAGAELCDHQSCSRYLRAEAPFKLGQWPRGLPRGSAHSIEPDCNLLTLARV